MTYFTLFGTVTEVQDMPALSAAIRDTIRNAGAVLLDVPWVPDTDTVTDQINIAVVEAVDYGDHTVWDLND